MQDHKLAVLIDADNVPYANVKEMLEEISKSGTPTVKRIYGDWTKPHLSGWKNVLLDNAIIPIQQYSYTTGKNSSDSALIIDAMDILYSEKVDGFCIVSSDSDFTRLATRLREAGMLVIGLGERKTPKPFIAACNKFIYIEILKPVEKEEDVPAPVKSISKETSKPTQKAIDKVDKKIVTLIVNSVDDLADETGWTFLGSLGSFISKKKPDFDPRNYGFNKLYDLIKYINRFEIDERDSGGHKHVKHIYLRLK
ncbi:OST-HTH/LOTUS domain-containing protein [Sphingobacterium nematocida]|uniref:OST-HTH/LOTUS domain-containing protein n=1 Tax=Sphingobacterium nematocida TaxID=1513896 RepID=A0A1T5G0X9_9SPHI|nr:NYN domain-containing protein [Sphingobacterium nematocida]SKC01924.1 OST-HTH/LOTUS domain-containing protein [Sphingobacterium nematocida]